MTSVFYGWWIVLACSAIMTYNGGILFYGFTAFFTPLIEEFGWSRAATSLAFGLYRLEGGLIAPITGYFLDRIGPKKMMMASVAVVGLGFVFLSRINSLAGFYAVFLFISFGTSLGFVNVGNYAVANWFVKKRGMALGLFSSGMSLCGFLVPVLAWVITTWGWRAAAVVAGVGMWIIGAPLALAIRDRPEPYGLFPDGEKPEGESQVHAEEVSVSGPSLGGEREFTFRQAVRTRSFWLYSLALSVPYMSTAGLFVHQMPFLLKIGIPVETAALVVSGTVLLSGLGRLGAGWMSDRYSKRHLMAIIMLCQFIGIMFFANVRELWHVVPFMLIFGLGYGGMTPLRTAIQCEYFGTLEFGTIQGVLYAIWSMGTVLGPVMAGLFFDLTGDYRMVFMIFGAATVAAIPLILASRPPALKKSIQQL